MVIYDIPIEKTLVVNSSLYEVDPKNMYQFKVMTRAKRGNGRSAYLTIIFLDATKTEVQRRYKFITNFNDEEREYAIISGIPATTKYAVVGYRVNCEGAIPFHTIIDLPPMEDHTLDIVDNQILESHDDIYDYREHYKQYDLEKDHWTIVGGNKNEEAFKINGSNKLNKLILCGLKPSSTILDVGCGTGILVKPLEDYIDSPKNYVGTDISNDAILFCKKHYPNFEFYVSEMSKLPPLNRKFDMMCLFSVFTHMHPPEITDYLKNMKSCLNDGGCIVASVILNQEIPTYSGTRNRMEINKTYFLQIVKIAGFTNIAQIDPDSMSQVVFKIS